DGESNSAPLDRLPEERERLQNLISNYSLHDVFNCDKTGLYWNTEPSKTLATNKISGTKNSKNRVTIHLTCNATGCEKFILVVGIP
ncbi:17462_t:CDS:1, partial [Entrophospora sp. SA101]